jgi:poly [ADP-ribose] polymerase
VEADIKSKGGAVAASVTKKCTHLVTTQADFAGQTAKVVAAAAAGIPVVSEEWLAECARVGGLADTTKFALGAAAVAAKAAPVVVPPPAKKGKAAAAAAPVAAAAAPPPVAPKAASKKEPAAAAAAAAPAAAFTGVIPVEKGLAESGKLFNPSVHADYAWLGNQVNIDGANNNKFYRGQVVCAGGRFYSWTRWGRVGEPGQNNLDGPSDVGSAIAAFEKKFKDKTGYAWAGNQGSYPGGKKDKYTVIFESFESTQGPKLAAATSGGGAVTYAPAKITGTLAAFTAFVTDADMFKAQLATMGVDTAKMPLGDISQRTVDAGFDALIAIEDYLKAGGGKDLARLCGQFYTYIPHNFGRAKAPLLTLADIAAKKQMLNVIGDVGAAVQSEQASGGGGAAGGGVVPAAIDSKYASLGCSLTPVDPASATFKLIQTYTENTQGSRKCRVLEAFAVERADGFDAHSALGNRKLLWHGTNVAVVAAILKSGLRIMPHSGGRVGSGIYLASENGKSAGYVTAQGHNGVMFLCEAVLGKQHFITRDGQVGHSDKDPVSARGCHSVLAVGSTEPDPAADATVVFDGHSVVVPQGKVGPNALLKEHGGSSSYSQSEYLVYKESQVRIRYVLKLHFETAGGHWH